MILVVLLVVACIALWHRGRVDAFSPGVGAQVVGGTWADYRAFPWFCSLQSARGAHRCGGVLIGPDLVVTAAHCTLSPVDRVVVGGDEVHSVKDRAYSGVFATNWEAAKASFDALRNMIIQHDIALLRLGSRSRKRPIPLATALPAPNTGVYILGRGVKRAYDEANPGTFSDFSFTQARLTYVTGQQAVKLLDQEPGDIFATAAERAYYRRAMLAPGVITCVSSDRKGGCIGDSGGPLVVNTPTGHKLLGLVHGGPYGCNFRTSKTFFSFFASIPYNIGWIQAFAAANTLSGAGLRAMGCGYAGRLKRGDGTYRCPDQFPWDAGVWDQGGNTPAGYQGKQCAQTSLCADMLNQLYRAGGAQTRPVRNARQTPDRPGQPRPRPKPPAGQ